MENRDMKFGRLLAIANVLGERVFEKGKLSVAQKHMTRFKNNPRKALEKIHFELLEYAPKFGPDELQLMDMFGEIMADMGEADFTGEPLNPKYLLGYHKQQDSLHNVIGVDEASKLWGLTPGTIKNYCAEGKVKAKKIGKTWAIDKNQPNPKGGSKVKYDDKYFYMYADARDVEQLSHEDAVKKLKSEGLKEDVVNAISDDYQKQAMEDVWDSED